MFCVCVCLDAHTKQVGFFRTCGFRGRDTSLHTPTLCLTHCSHRLIAAQGLAVEELAVTPGCRPGAHLLSLFSISNPLRTHTQSAYMHKRGFCAMSFDSAPLAETHYDSASSSRLKQSRHWS